MLTGYHSNLHWNYIVKFICMMCS